MTKPFPTRDTDARRARAGAGASAGFPSVRTFRLYACAFLVAPVFADHNIVAIPTIAVGCLLTVHLIASSPRMPWYGALSLGISLYWIIYGAAIGSLPALGQVPGFITTEGRVLVALIPLAGLSGARTYPEHFKVLERLFELIAALGGVSVVAWELGVSVGRTSDLFFGFTSSHHAVAYVHAVALIVLFTTRGRRTGLAWTIRSGLILACLLVIVESGSRATLTGLALGALSTIAWRLSVDRLVKVMSAAVIVLAVTIAFVPRVTDTVRSFLEPSFRQQIVDVYADGATNVSGSQGDVNVLLRVGDFATAIRDFTSSPFVGIGPWRFDDEVTRSIGVEGVVSVAVGGVQVHSDHHAHNLYLQVLAETGIVGFVLMFSLWFGLLVLIRRRYLSPATPQYVRPWLQASWYAIVLGLGISMTDIGLINVALTFGLGVVVSTTLAAVSHAD